MNHLSHAFSLLFLIVDITLVICSFRIRDFWLTMFLLANALIQAFLCMLIFSGRSI